jgi:hypothetical protein
LTVLTLEPEEWHKYRLLEPAYVEERLKEYWVGAKYDNLRLVESPAAQKCNAELRHGSEHKFNERFKRVYEVELRGAQDSLERRLVMAKSVGWGWLSYHAFLAGQRLAEFVPPVLGLRDGILFTEWIPQSGMSTIPGRAEVVETLGRYIVSRAGSLRLDHDPAPELSAQNRYRGFEEISGTLSRAYGSKVASVLKRPRLRAELVARHSCPVPALIDGRLRPCEWIVDSGRLLKTDFEHHGMGKTELSVTDPAYDLADAILHWNLSAEEERRLIDIYRWSVTDSNVEQRLFLNKLLAGTWAMELAHNNLQDARLAARHEEFNRRYMEALHFLIAAATRATMASQHDPDLFINEVRIACGVGGTPAMA